MRERGPNLYSYIVAFDGGLAPNPWWEYCTLAVCKPQIRRTADQGDWIVGLSPKKFGHRMVYAMKIEEVLSFDEYFEDSKFELKIPDLDDLDDRRLVGDNLYRPEGGGYVQLPSLHSFSDGSLNEMHMRRDLSGERVLVGAEYYYFGVNGERIPENLDFLKVRRGHRCNFSLEETWQFLRYLENLSPGINGTPRDFERAVNRLRVK